MSEAIVTAQMSRSRMLRSGAAVAALAAAGRPPSASAAERGRAVGRANVRVSNDRYGVHVEPSVAGNPRHPRRLLAACQVSPTADPEFIATYRSLDGGTSWRSGAVPQLPAARMTSGSDVTVAFDQRGRGYLCAASGHHNDSHGHVWRTDDGGRSFSAAVPLPEASVDHPWIATGTGRTPSEHNVYVAWESGSREELRFTRSTDGGQSFETPRTIIPLDSMSGQLAGGAHGLICAVAERRARQEASGETRAQVVAACSTDGGKSFGAPIMLGTDAPVLDLPGGVLPNSGPTVAVDPSDNALYVAFTTRSPGAVHSDIMVTASHDGGRTWSRPAAATPHDRIIYFQPNLAVDAAGRIAISAFALAKGRIDQVLVVSGPRKLEFGQPLKVTTTPFDPHTGTASRGKHGAWWVGDYQGIAAVPGGFQLVWNDARTGKLELFAATVRP